MSILRARNDVADLYVLGDSPIHYGTDQVAAALTDERLSAVAADERSRYVACLREGHGFDDDYVVVRRPDLNEPANGDGGARVALVAARLGRTRLIDNLEFDPA